MKDTYRTITKASPEALFKDRNSRFFGYAFPVRDQESIETHLEELKSRHHKARHWCYAWKLGKEQVNYRVNDGGEPANTAGMPIYGQIQSFDLTEILVVVVRYFGGVKLGVGGLISSYRRAAQLALKASQITTRTIDQAFQISFGYPQMNIVMRIIKENNLTITDQQFEISCRILIRVRKKEARRIFDTFNNTYKVEIRPLEP